MRVQLYNKIQSKCVRFRIESLFKSFFQLMIYCTGTGYCVYIMYSITSGSVYSYNYYMWYMWYSYYMCTCGTCGTECVYCKIQSRGG